MLTMTKVAKALRKVLEPDEDVPGIGDDMDLACDVFRDNGGSNFFSLVDLLERVEAQIDKDKE